MEPTVERRIQRHIDLDATPADVWDAVCDPAAWLADGGTLPLEPGGVGHLVEDGRTRTAVVEVVETGRRLVYRWWDDDDPSEPSRVEITLVGAGAGTRVTVREAAVTPGAQASAISTGRAARAWDLRLLCLALLGLARSPVLA
jgi:uncharacterized protein YndB with AHSA1/START domain